jgi:hypothetical protein
MDGTWMSLARSQEAQYKIQSKLAVYTDATIGRSGNLTRRERLKHRTTLLILPLLSSGSGPSALGLKYSSKDDGLCLTPGTIVRGSVHFNCPGTRYAADVAISTRFGPTKPTRLKLVVKEVKDQNAEVLFRQANVA